MATSKKVSHENLRQKYLDILIDFLSTKKDENGEDDGEEVLRVGSNVIAFPVVDENGEDEFIEITVKVPLGTKDEAYDGYARQEEYLMKEKEKKEKAKEKAKAKAEKIERDKKLREQKKLMKEKEEQRKVSKG